MNLFKHSKKLLAVLLGVVMLGGCAQVFPVSPPNIPGGFTCIVDLQKNNIEARMQVTKAGDEWTFVLYEPTALDGAKMVLENNNATFEFAGIVIETEMDDSPVTSCAQLIVEILNQAATKENLNAKRTEQGIEVRGNSDSGDYTLLFHSQTNNLMMIENEEMGFVAEISDFTVGNEPSANQEGDMELPE